MTSLHLTVVHIFRIPAACTSLEQGFSIAGRTVEDRRCELTNDTVDEQCIVY